MIYLLAILNVLQNYQMHFYMNTNFYWEEYHLYDSQDKEQDFFLLVFDIHKLSSFWKYIRTLLYLYQRDLINCVDINECHFSKVYGKSEGKVFQDKIQACRHINVYAMIHFRFTVKI
jgi:hypothetical protein